MKTLLSILILGSVAFSASAAENNPPVISSADKNMPAECKAYYNAIDKLVEKNPSAGKKLLESMDDSAISWSTMSKEEKEAASEGCMVALEEIKAML